LVLLAGRPRLLFEGFEGLRKQRFDSDDDLIALRL